MRTLSQNQSTKSVDYRVFVFAAMLPAMVVWFIFWKYTDICLEDALITYRYAENLASGNGFVYNHGERVLGTTTPLYTMMLAAGARLFGIQTIPALSNALSAISGLLVGWFTYRVLLHVGIGKWLSTIATLFLLVQPQFVVTVAGGMETMLVLALMAGSLYALCLGRYHVAVALCALLVLARIDGVVWACVVFLIIIMERMRRLPSSLALFSLILLPWFVFASSYFGSAIPHSVIAKKTVVYEAATSLDLGANFVVHMKWFCGALGISYDYVAMLFGKSDVVYLFVMFVFACLFVIGAIWVFREKERRPLVSLIVFPPLLCIAYLVGQAPRMFDWYLIPALWCCTILIALGWIVLFERARGQSSMPQEWRQMAVAVASIVLLTNTVIGNMRENIFNGYYQSVEKGLRLQVGLWLADRTPKDASVAMEAIGYQGTFSRRRIIDLAGLISPDVVRIHAESESRGIAFQRVLDELKPGYLVLRSFEVDRNINWHGGRLFEDRRQAKFFKGHYREVKRFSTAFSDFWGPAGYITVFERRPKDG